MVLLPSSSRHSVRKIGEGVEPAELMEEKFEENDLRD